MRRHIGASYNKHSTSDTTSDMIVSVNRQITVCTCWQTSSRALLALAGPGLSLVWNETYFVDAIVTHTPLPGTRIIIENIRRVFLWQTPVSPLSGTRRTLWTRLSHTSLPGTSACNTYCRHSRSLGLAVRTPAPKDVLQSLGGLQTYTTDQMDR